jgi:hypothetical protein
VPEKKSFFFQKRIVINLTKYAENLNGRRVSRLAPVLKRHKKTLPEYCYLAGTKQKTNTMNKN